MYVRYEVDQLIFLNGYLIFVDKFTMLKFKIDIPKSVSYSFNYQNFKLFCDLLKNAKTIDFMMNSIIINNEEIIIPDKVDDYHSDFDCLIDDVLKNECNFKCNVYSYWHGLDYYKKLYDLKKLYMVVMDSKALHLVNSDDRDVQAFCRNKNHDVFPLAFDSYGFSRFLIIANHFKSDFCINPEDQMICFNNGENCGIMAGVELNSEVNDEV